MRIKKLFLSLLPEKTVAYSDLPAIIILKGNRLLRTTIFMRDIFHLLMMTQDVKSCKKNIENFVKMKFTTQFISEYADYFIRLK